MLERLIDTHTASLNCETGPDTVARITSRLATTRQALDRLEGESSTGCKDQTDRTSACKAKRLPEVDRLRIAQELSRMRSGHAEALSDYLLAGVRAGLRPSEWENVVVLSRDAPGCLALLVVNGKFDDRRAHGPTRTLAFTALPDADKDAILRWLRRSRRRGPPSKPCSRLSAISCTS